MAQTETGAIRLGHSEDNRKWMGLGVWVGVEHFCEREGSWLGEKGVGFSALKMSTVSLRRGSTCVVRLHASAPST